MENIKDKEIESGRRYNFNFLILTLGQTVSNLCSRITGFAISLFVLNKTGSATAFASIMALTILPGIIVNVIAGVFVDRHDKKKIMVKCDTAIGLIEILIMLLFEANFHLLTLVTCFVIILSIFQGIFEMAFQAAIPNIVSNEKVAQANSTFQGIGALIAIIGPILGAVLYISIGIETVFLIDGISFIFAAFCGTFLKLNQNIEKTDKKINTSYLDSIKESIKYLKTQETICFFMVVAVIINFVYNPLIFVVLPYVLNNVIKVSAFQLSLTRATIGVGAIVGAIVVSIQKSNNTIMKRFFLLLQVQAVLMLLWVFPNLCLFDDNGKWITTIVFMILLFIYQLLNMIQNIPVFTFFQVKVPDEMRGRVMSFVGLALGLSTPAGMFIYGLLLKVINWGYLSVGTGVIIFAICMYCKRCKYYKNFLQEIVYESKEKSEGDVQNIVEEV